MLWPEHFIECFSQIPKATKFGRLHVRDVHKSHAMINLQSFYWFSIHFSALRWSSAHFFSRQIVLSWFFFVRISCDRQYRELRCYTNTVLLSQSPGTAELCGVQNVAFMILFGSLCAGLISFGFNFLFIYLCIRFCSNGSKHTIIISFFYSFDRARLIFRLLCVSFALEWKQARNSCASRRERE